MHDMTQNLNHDLSAFVPSLTRHAQALAGSDHAAADLVRLCLELLAVQPERLSGDDARVDLFRAFHDLWSPRRGDAADDAVLRFPGVAKSDLPGEDALEKCVLQLIYVERFSRRRVADILSISEHQIAEILLKKERRTHQRVHASALIIEDDSLMAKHMNEIAQELGLTVIQVADGVERAVCAALDERPAIILTDLQLRKGESGLIATRAILQRRRVPVVFVTGYPWMLEPSGGEADPFFVVPKPFRPRALKTKIAEALDLYSDRQSAEAYHARLLAKIRDLLGGPFGGHSLH